MEVSEVEDGIENLRKKVKSKVRNDHPDFRAYSLKDTFKAFTHAASKDTLSPKILARGQERFSVGCFYSTHHHAKRKKKKSSKVNKASARRKHEWIV